ncbi:hypothetical protein EVAR_23229_1 [Eumeta japonica]|uniref:Uncharacterized protein n=1 Tax=Eumeta variegata TaxID=151549 RepID=A0A4C1VF86_EUMVA|nr:hypothetical protein EVAR_23229_1 [Eumeta japonica]
MEYLSTLQSQKFPLFSRSYKGNFRVDSGLRASLTRRPLQRQRRAVIAKRFQARHGLRTTVMAHSSSIIPQPIFTGILPSPSAHSFLNEISYSYPRGRQAPTAPEWRVSMISVDHLSSGGSHTRLSLDNALKICRSYRY